MAERLGIPRSKIDVIPRGRSEAALGMRTEERRRTARAELGLADDVPVVMAAGRHYHMKGLDVLVGGFPMVKAAIPDAQLVILGREGPSTPELKTLIAEGGIADSVTLAGYRNDVPDMLCAADVFVLPSRAEGSPGALIEALALEAPAVASNIPSVTELAGDTDEIVKVFPVGSRTGMAESVVSLIANPDHARELARRGRQRYLARYTLERVADGMVEFFKRSVA